MALFEGIPDDAVRIFAIVGALVALYYVARVVFYVLSKMLDYCRWRCCGRKLQGKLVVVIGASSGIGKACVESFAKRGANVILVSRRKEALEKVALNCNVPTENCVACDCADAEAVAALANKILSEHGCPHALVLSAGFGRWSYITSQAPAEISKNMQAPCMAAAHAVRSFLPAMLKDKTEKRSILIPMSPVAFFTWPACTMYTANRWGLRGLCEALKQDLHGSHVSAVMCTFGETDSGYWDANPGSRPFVPWISRTGLIPTLSSEYCGERICRAHALGKKRICENFQISLLIELMHICPSLIEWCMRWFRSSIGSHLEQAIAPSEASKPPAKAWTDESPKKVDQAAPLPGQAAAESEVRTGDALS